MGIYETYDPFSEWEPKSVISDVVIQEVVNPVPGNSILGFVDTLTDFEKGLLIGFILIYLLQEL